MTSQPSPTAVCVPMIETPRRLTALLLLDPAHEKRTSVDVRAITALWLEPDTLRPAQLAEYECVVALLQAPYVLRGVRIAVQNLRGDEAKDLAGYAQWAWDQARADYVIGLAASAGPA